MREKIIGMAVVMLLAGGAISVAGISTDVGQPSNEQRRCEHVTIDFSKPFIHSDNDQTIVTVTEANSFLHKPGKPKLPYYGYCSAV
jgi:hypothetical protein